MENPLDTSTDLGKLVHRMNRAYGCFLVWKYIRKSTSIPESGQAEAERRTGIMNRYGGIFSAILYAVENAFITDLHKFFDKPRGSLKLQTLIENLPDADKKEAESLLDDIGGEIERIETLRHNFTAHEPKKPEEEKIFTLEIEKIFSVVQQILNIISKNHGGNFMTWDLWEGNNEASLTHLLNDLELGHQGHIEEIEKGL
jgi:hypothetical protein